MLTVHKSNSGPLSGPPMTWVLAEDVAEHDRTIYYVDVRKPWPWQPIDGMSLRYRHYRRHPQSMIVDSMTMGPLSRAEQPMYPGASSEDVRCQNGLLSQSVAQDADASEYRVSPQIFSEWLWRTERIPVHDLLRSELEIVHFNQHFLGLPSFNYVRETVHQPDLPNDIKPNSLGPSKRILAFAKVAAIVQADSGFARWANRVWFVDYSDSGPDGRHDHVDGYHAPTDWSDCIDHRSIAAGMPSLPFDPRSLTTNPEDAARAFQDKTRWLPKKETQ